MSSKYIISQLCKIESCCFGTIFKMCAQSVSSEGLKRQRGSTEIPGTGPWRHRCGGSISCHPQEVAASGWAWPCWLRASCRGFWVHVSPSHQVWMLWILPHPVDLRDLYCPLQLMLFWWLLTYLHFILGIFFPITEDNLKTILFIRK